MSPSVFSRESRVIDRARQELAEGGFTGQGAESFALLLHDYEKLFRQSTRLVKMGDRMQSTLNILNRNLRLSESKYRGIFEQVVEGIFRTDSAGKLVEVNPAMSAMFRYESPQALLAEVTHLTELFHCDKAKRSYREIFSSGAAIKGLQAEMRRSDGSSLWVEISAGPLGGDCDPDKRETAEGAVGVIADVTERLCMMEEMCRLARTDSMTGLWNRGYFCELARREIAVSRRSGRALAVLLLDVDHFKGVNDTYGHDAGDRALISLAETLRETIREVDIPARYGGEEFCVLLPGISPEGACTAAERIRSAIEGGSVPFEDGSFRVTVSIGIAFFRSPGMTLDQLLKHADIALYGAKKNGRNRIEIYQPSDGCHSQSSTAGAGL